MLRMNLKPQWYSLSHPAMEAALIEVSIMLSFAGMKINGSGSLIHLQSWYVNNF